MYVKIQEKLEICKNVAISKKEDSSLESLFSLDVGDMRCVCFFGVFSSSPVCTICLQSDLSLE